MATTQQEVKSNKNTGAKGAPPPQSSAQSSAQPAVDGESEAVTTTPTVGAPVPEGFERRAGDLLGYWESASYNDDMSVAKEGSPPVLFTPLHVTMQDNKEEPKNASILIHCRLEHEALLRSADKDGGYVTLPAGSMFGIWYKAGMKPISNMGGVKVWMGNDGCKRIKTRKKPMGMFDIRSAEDGEKLKCTEDRRERSLPIALQRKRLEEQENPEANPDDEFIPF